MAARTRIMLLLWPQVARAAELVAQDLGITRVEYIAQLVQSDVAARRLPTVKPTTPANPPRHDDRELLIEHRLRL